MDLKCDSSWETSSNWKCMIKENKKDERLETAQIMVIKFMYNGRLHVGVLFFFFSFFVNWTICVVWYCSARSIKDMCGISVVYISLEFAVSIQW